MDRKCFYIVFFILLIQLHSNAGKLIEWDFGNSANNAFCGWEVTGYNSYEIVNNKIKFHKIIYSLDSGLRSGCKNPGPVLSKSLTPAEQNQIINGKRLVIETGDRIESLNFVTISTRNSLNVRDTKYILCGVSLFDTEVTFLDNKIIIDISNFNKGDNKVEEISFSINDNASLCLTCEAYAVGNAIYYIDKIYLENGISDKSITPLNLLLE